MSASPPRGRSATNHHIRRGLARSISPRRRVMKESKTPSPSFHSASPSQFSRTPSPFNGKVKHNQKSSSFSQMSPPRRTRSLTRRSASAPMKKTEPQNSQLSKLKEYRPRSFFIAVTVHARPLGIKLHSLDGRYLEVLSVDPKGHGARNGLRKGDLIVQINEDCFGNAPEGLEMLLNSPLPLEIHVRRLNAMMSGEFHTLSWENPKFLLWSDLTVFLDMSWEKPKEADAPGMTPERSQKSSQDGQATLSGSSTSRSDRGHIRRNSLERRKPH